MAEIGGWSSLAPERRRAIMSELDARKAKIADREVVKQFGLDQVDLPQVWLGGIGSDA